MRLRGQEDRAGEGTLDETMASLYIHSGNPAGRPKGSRNKFSERLIEAFALDFERYGKDAIEQVRAEKPHEYLRIAASLVPKQFEIEDGRQPFAVIPGQSQSKEEWEREFTPIATRSALLPQPCETAEGVDGNR